MNKFYLYQEFSNEFVVNKDKIEKFISLSDDRNPLHTDRDYAFSKGFESIVVHGNIQNCFISFFIGECLPTKEVILLSNSIDYIAPIYLNQKLFFNSTVTGLFESVGVVEFKFVFTSINGEKLSKGKIKVKILK